MGRPMDVLISKRGKLGRRYSGQFRSIRSWIGIIAMAIMLMGTVACLPCSASGSVRADGFASTTILKGEYGEFSVNGSLSGTLVPLGTTCGASRAIASLNFVWFGKIGTLKGVPATSNVAMEIDLGRARYGTSGRFGSTLNKPAYVTFDVEGISTPNRSWRSVSGTYTTAKRGSSGSIDVSMVPTGATKGGRLDIRGSWRGCA